EAQTEQTKLLDLSVQGLNDEQMGNLLLLAEVAGKVPKAEVAAKNTDEFNGQNLTVKMNLTVKEESFKRKSTEELAGKKSKRKELQSGECPEGIIEVQVQSSNLSSSSANIKVHVGAHIAGRPYSCRECNKKFSRSSTLKDHRNTHTGKKPHSCLICNESFAHSSTLRNHIGIHNGVKLHNCRECEKSFRLKQHLKKHMEIHNKIRQLFNCTVCSKGFLSKW
ncbi:zinc finger protein, partial [Loa loa]